MSSLWRAVEGAVLDLTLSLLQPVQAATGLRLVLPMYDGALFAVPEQGADLGRRCVEAAFSTALAAAGVAAGVTAEVRPRWGGTAP